jgi:hypothetical protein
MWAVALAEFLLGALILGNEPIRLHIDPDPEEPHEEPVP